jgi:NAD(P)-dependent dehydrogenase (short-subunit alcohol dehydrogenase family)
MDGTAQRFQDKVALVTGAGSGIGLAIAKHLAAEGARVAIADIADATDIAATIPGSMAVALDVVSDPGWIQAMAMVEEHWAPVELLVNNAGITLPGSIESIALEDWQRTLDVDLTGVFLGCRHAIAAMRKVGRGAIVNISSAYGIKADPDYVAYNAAKSEIILMTRSIALHCAREALGIRCNVVHPGVILTPMLADALAATSDPRAEQKRWKKSHPIGRLGETGDIARMVAFLLSDDASFVTGAAYVVDGGLSL